MLLPLPVGKAIWELADNEKWGDGWPRLSSAVGVQGNGRRHASRKEKQQGLRSARASPTRKWANQRSQANHDCTH